MSESMSPNMMLIAKIEAERRKAGARSYGAQVAQSDYSHLKVKQVRRQEKDAICTKCGGKFIKPSDSKQRVCDECLKKSLKVRQNKQYAKTIKCKCAKCGKTLWRVYPENAICKQCREKEG